VQISYEQNMSVDGLSLFPKKNNWWCHKKTHMTCTVVIWNTYLKSSYWKFIFILNVNNLKRNFFLVS